MNSCVLDASVAVKWVLPSADEKYVSQALLLQRAHVDGRLGIFVPDLFWTEVGNILWKAARTSRITAQAAHEGLGQILSRDTIVTIPTRPLMEDAWSIAKDFDRTFYDSTYVALAVAQNAPFVTADERLVNATGAYFPVRWLGAI